MEENKDQTTEQLQEDKPNHQGEGGGRPPLDEEEKRVILQKLQPYLQSGLSINKACVEANIKKSTVYDYIKKDEKFAEEINRYKQYMSIMYNNTINAMLLHIVSKIQRTIPSDNNGGNLESVKLSQQEYDFIKWFGTNSKQTREEYGERKEIGIVDPEVEIAKITALIDEQAK